jgi:hypothetical protein
MKTKFISLLAAAVFGLGAVSASLAGESLGLAGKWNIDLEKSTPIRPWEQRVLDITIAGGTVQIVRHLQWGRDRKVADTTLVNPDDKTVTRNPVGYWLDTWYTNVYIGGDRHKQVTGGWLDGGRVLKLETNLMLEAQQGDHPVHIYDEFRLSPDGRTLTQFQLRSTRDQALVYVYNRE